MEAASKNAKEMIDVADDPVQNKARSGEITKELLDIVGGAEALKQRSGGHEHREDRSGHRPVVDVSRPEGCRRSTTRSSSRRPRTRTSSRTRRS